MATYYCWHCYGRNPQGSGRCQHCGHEIATPTQASMTDTLIWAARHPDPDVAIMAVRRLGVHGDLAAAAPLRELLDDPPDPYVEAEALRSLVKLCGADKLEDLLTHLARHGPVLIQNAAREALGDRA